jgi:arylsulfatase A-like enzyme
MAAAMTARFLWSRAALAGALALAAASCARRDDPVVHDLSAAAPFAEPRAAWSAFRPGTIEAELAEERGFRRATRFGDGDVPVLVRERATLLLALGASRRLVLDVAPEPGREGDDLEVAVAGTAVGRHRLVPGRQRIAFDVPADVQRAGRTRVRLTVTEPGRPSAAVARAGGVAARLFGIAWGGAGDPALDALASGRIRHPVSVEGGAVEIPAPAGLRYALLLPPDAALRFAVEWRAGTACDGGEARVRVEDEAGRVHTAWRGRPAAPGASREIVAPLPGGPRPAFVTLEADAPAGCATAVARWVRPRVHGRAALPGLSPSPTPEGDEVAGLRRGLRGAGVVLVVLDAAQAARLSGYGYGRATTPEIDRLAAEGVVFEAHATPAPFTYAAMAALWTSRAPDDGGGEWIAGGILPASLPTLAEILAARGIPTAALIANPSAGPAFGLDRGFARVERLYREPWTTGPPPTAEVFARALPGWAATARAPFFLYLHLREPHMPFGEPLFGEDGPLPREAREPAFWDAVNRGDREPTAAELDHLGRLYDGNLRAADRAVGDLRRRLEALGLWERSVVIVTSDHGEALGEHGYVGHNLQLYEESVRVPLVVRFPAALGPRGVRLGAQTSHLDLAPTIADVFGAAHAASSFRGRSLLPALYADPPPAAVVARTAGTRPAYALRAGRHKFVVDPFSSREELYDIGRDPREKDDLAGRSPLWTAVYRQMLGRWLVDTRRAAVTADAASAPDARDREALRALGYVR